MLLGRAGQENYNKAYKAVFLSLGDESGPFKRALEINTAVRGCDLSLKALGDFMASRWKSGLDIQTTDTKNVVYDEAIRDAITREGVILEYVLPRDLRPHLRLIAHRAAEVVKGSRKFQEGLEALQEGKPLSFSEQTLWHDRVKNLDREVLLGLDALRRAVMDVTIRARGEESRGHDFVGPTGWSFAGAERVILGDFLQALESKSIEDLVGHCISVGKNFKFRDYYFKDEDEALRRTMRFLIRLPTVLQDLQKVIGEKAAFVENLSLVGVLDDLAPPDETTRSYLSAPPPYSILYGTDARDSEGTKKVELLFVHSMASVQISDETNPHLVCRWTSDINGDLRTWSQWNHIPLDGEDVGISSEEFDALSRQLEERSLAVLKKLSSVWEQFPSLYGLSLAATRAVAITESANALSFQVASVDGNNLRAAIEQDMRRQGLNCQLSVDDKGSETKFTLTLTRIPASQGTTALDISDIKEDESGSPQITRQFVKDYCSDYYELLRQLKKFGVTVEHGRGSHDCLCLGGYKVAISQNQRDGTLLMNRHVIRQILRCLRIDESDFARGITTKVF